MSLILAIILNIHFTSNIWSFFCENAKWLKTMRYIKMRNRIRKYQNHLSILNNTLLRHCRQSWDNGKIHNVLIFGSKSLHKYYILDPEQVGTYVHTSFMSMSKKKKKVFWGNCKIRKYLSKDGIDLFLIKQVIMTGTI